MSAGVIGAVVLDPSCPGLRVLPQSMSLAPRANRRRSLMLSTALIAILSAQAMQLAHAQSVTVAGDVSPAGATSPVWNIPPGAAMMVGVTQPGSLTIADGGVVTMSSNLYHRYIGGFGGSDNGQGIATVTGAGSRWDGAGMIVGYQNLGTLNITAGGTVSASDITMGHSGAGNGSVTVSGTGSKLLGTGSLHVGYVGPATLYIDAGGTVTSASGAIAYNPYGPYSAGGTVMVSGAGSRWDNAGTLHVGHAGQGVLYINGGTATASDVILGLQAGSSGSLSLVDGGRLETGQVERGQGSGSLLLYDGTLRLTGNQADLFSGFTAGDIVVGAGGATIDTQSYAIVTAAALSGTGALTKTGAGALTLTGSNTYTGGTYALGGTLQFGNGTQAGTNSLGAGAIIVGNGALLSIEGPASVSTSGLINIGDTGDGVLLIADGGTLSGDWSTIGHGAGTIGNASVAGAGSAWTSTILDLGGTLGGYGALTVADGGSVTASVGRLGRFAGSSGSALVIGTGSSWVNTGSLHIGGQGNGDLTVADGGLVTADGGYIGTDAGSTATALVTGAGSLWTNNVLFVGYGENGTLTVADGGKVTAVGYDSYIGMFAGSTGAATVTGAGSTLAYSKDLIIGYAQAAGTLTVADGGLVTNTNASLGKFAGSTGTARVTGAGSSWVTNLSLEVGKDGNGALVVEDGGSVTSTFGFVAGSAGSTGTATVTGAGSAWHNDSLVIGYEGSASLSVADGGLVTSTGGTIGLWGPYDGLVTVSGAGSRWENADRIHVGDGGAGSLDIRDGGTVATSTLTVGAGAGSTGSLSLAAGGILETGQLARGNGNGSVVFDGGLLRLTANQADLFSGFSPGDIVLDPDGVTIDTQSYATASSAVLSGTGGLTKIGSGTLILTGSNIYTGDTLAFGGTLQFGDGSLGGSNTVGFGNIIADNGGLLSIQGPASLTTAGGINVGFIGNGTLTVADGGLVADSVGEIGSWDGSNGSALVTGAGSTWANDLALSVGAWGSHGTLTVADGGLVTTDYGRIGLGPGSTGIALVTGAGSTWTNNFLSVGVFGNGALTVADGGTVAASAVTVAVDTGSTGSLKLNNSGVLETGQLARGDGNGSLAFDGGLLRLTDNQADLFSGFSPGDIVLDQGGATIDTQAYAVASAAALSGTGGVTKIGTGTLTLNGSNTYAGDTRAFGGTLQFGDGALGGTNTFGNGAIYVDNGGLLSIQGPATVSTAWGTSVGYSGSGALTIANGGTLSDETGRIGSWAGSTGSATVTGAGSIWASSNGFDVGLLGSGTLTVADGGLITDDYGRLGVEAGSTGTALVTGAGSAWINSSTLEIGQWGTGSLTLADGGSVANGLGIVGDNAGSTGSVTVTGSGSTWTNQGLFVGSYGSGTLTVAAGGTVSDAYDTYIGAYAGSTGSVTVTGAGSTLADSHGLRIGYEGSASLDVTDGGRVSNTAGLIAYGAGAVGSVTVSGAGSRWDNSTLLTVGRSGVGTLDIGLGATVSSADGDIGHSLGSSGTVSVSGAGSRWDNAGVLIVGRNGTGTLGINASGMVASSTVTVAVNAGSTGSLLLNNGGVLETGQLARGAGNGSVSFDGGMLRLTGDQADLFNGFSAGDIVLTEGGATIDTQSYTVASSAGLAGNGGLQKTGSGSLTLTGSNSYLGDTVIDAGWLQFGSGLLGGTNTLGGDIRVNAGTLSLQTAATVSAAGDLIFADNTGLDILASFGTSDLHASSVVIGNGVVLNLSGIDNPGQLGQVLLDTDHGIAGDFAMVTVGGFHGPVDYLTVLTGKSGDGKQYLATYGLSWTARSNLAHGTFTLTNPSDSFTVGVALADEPTNPALAWNGTALTKSGPGTLILSADNIYSGGTTINGGTLQLGAGGTAGSLLGDVTNNGTLAFNRSDAFTFSGTISGGGSVVQDGPGTTTLTGANTYAGGTTISAGTLRVAADHALGDASGGVLLDGGTLAFGVPMSSARAVAVGPNGGNLLLDSGDVTLSGVLSGLGDLTKSGSHLLTYTGDSSGYTGAFTLAEGRLRLDGELGGTLVTAQGTTLSGIGTLGDVTVNGSIVPGNSIGTLTVAGDLVLNSTARLDYELETPGDAVIPDQSDLIVVTGNLTLGGNLYVTDAGGFGDGLYRLIEYGGTLTDNILTIASLPGTSSGVIQTSVPHQVNLVVGGSSVPPGVPNTDILFWDGTSTVANDAIEGGTATWNTSTTNWTLADGSTNIAWTDKFGIFIGTPGTVTIAPGGVSATGLQFAVDGYRIEGDTLRLTGDATLRIGDGTLGGSGITTTIASTIAGTNGLNKTNLGTAVLTGTNTYTGGTTISGGTIQLGDGGTSGSILGDVVNNGTLAFNRSDAVVFAGAISGNGSVAQIGAGTTTLTADNTYLRGTIIGSGTLRLSDGGTTGSILGDVANNGTLAFNRSDAVVFAGAISGNGSVAQIGSGTTTLVAANTYSGGTTINNGGSLIGSAASFGSGGIVNDGALTIDQSTAATFANTLSGSGSFTKAGAGSLRLTAESSAFTGRTFVDAGTLAVDGALGGPVDVQAGARLQGSGKVGTTWLAGTIAPGNGIGTLSIAGDATFVAGSIYEVEMTPALADRITVTGAADIQGGTVRTKKQGGVYLPGSQWTILSAAGGVTGTFDTVDEPLIYLGMRIGYDANNVFLGIERNNVSFCLDGFTRNQCETAKGTESLGQGNSLYDLIASQVSAQDAATAFDRLSGEIHASAKTALIEESRFPRDAALTRLRGAFGSAGAPTAPVMAYGFGGQRLVASDTDQLAFWGSGFGSWGRTQGDGNAAALGHDIGGFIVGADAPVFDNARFGVFSGYSRSRFEVNSRFSSGDSDNIYLGLFGGGRWGDLALRGGASYTWHDIATRRSVSFPGFSDSLTGDYSAHTAQVFGEIGYELRAGNLMLEPFANLAHVNLRTDDYQERGGVAALSAPAQSIDATFTTVGLNTSSRFTLGGMALTARGTLGWRHAFGDIVPTATQSFAGGAPFTIGGVPIARDSAVIGAGLDMALNPSTQLGLSYDGVIAADAQQHGVNVKLNVKF